MRKLTRFAAIAIALVLLVGGRYPLYYEIEPVSARIVDAETDEPISGAAVNVIWGMVQSTYHSGSSDAGWLGSQYASTNDHGYFSVPGWEKWWLEWFSTKRIDGASPRMRILKSGYVPTNLLVSALNENERNVVAHSSEVFWGVGQSVKGLSGQVIRLRRLPLEPSARYEAFHRTFVLPISERSCNLPKIVNSSVVTEIYREQIAAIQAGLDMGLSYADKQDILNYKESNIETCIRLAHYLRKQGL